MLTLRESMAHATRLSKLFPPGRTRRLATLGHCWLGKYYYRGGGASSPGPDGPDVPKLRAVTVPVVEVGGRRRAIGCSRVRIITASTFAVPKPVSENVNFICVGSVAARIMRNGCQPEV